ENKISNIQSPGMTAVKFKEYSLWCVYADLSFPLLSNIMKLKKWRCGKRSIGGTLVDLPIFLDN
ncbi:hypothetical protein, partial [Agathobacter rectalis]|uniref:hypothetical protein n=1 Tax=Agathobacter rectalis TaxID=39491 RepID=UPI0027D321B0